MYNSYSTPPPNMGYPHAPFAIPLQDNRYYFDAFKRELIMRYKLHQQLQIIKHQKDVCDAKLQFYQRKCQTAIDKQSISEPFNARIRRSRRTAVQIQRVYQCPHDKCSRSYGSQGSLQQHIKLKHAQQQLRSNKLIAQKYYPKQMNGGNYQAKINRLYNDLNNPQMRRNFNETQNKYNQSLYLNSKKIRDQNKDLQNIAFFSSNGNFINMNKSNNIITQTQFKQKQKSVQNLLNLQPLQTIQKQSQQKIISILSKSSPQKNNQIQYNENVCQKSKQKDAVNSNFNVDDIKKKQGSI